MSKAQFEISAATELESEPLSVTEVGELLPFVPPDADGKTIPGTLPLRGTLNVEEKKIAENIEHNTRLFLPQLRGFELQDKPIMIACGGPSLKKNLKKMRKMRERGYSLVTMNGTHDFMVENGFKPSLHVQIDARPFNTRFVQKPVEGCRYFLASQCDPSAFEALADEDLWIYHCSGHSKEIYEMLDDYYMGRYVRVTGGSTVAMNSFMVLRHLGFQYFDVFGFDSCVMGKAHHSYPQAENDGDAIHSMWARRSDGTDKEFKASTWMIRQAYDFQKFIGMIPDGLFKCRVHGAGLIAHMMKTQWKISLSEVLDDLDSQKGVE